MKSRNIKNHIASLLFAGILFTFTNCVSTRNVRPLEKDQIKLAMDLGGPIIILNDVPFPVPFTAFTFSYGVTSSITLSSSVFFTDALFGVMHIDAGSTFGIVKPKGFIPGLSITPSFSFMIDVWEWNPVFYPSADINLYWNIGPRNDILYVGMNNWFELSSTRANGDTQPQNWIPSINLGYTFMADKWMFTIETKYMGLNVNNQDIVVQYVSPGPTGAIGAVFSAARLF